MRGRGDAASKQSKYPPAMSVKRVRDPSPYVAGNGTWAPTSAEVDNATTTSNRVCRRLTKRLHGHDKRYLVFLQNHSRSSSVVYCTVQPISCVLDSNVYATICSCSLLFDCCSYVPCEHSVMSCASYAFLCCRCLQSRSRQPPPGNHPSGVPLIRSPLPGVFNFRRINR